jgi:hypothetical protein
VGLAKLHDVDVTNWEVRDIGNMSS